MPVISDPRLALRHAQAIPVLMNACGIDLSARTAFDARVRQLQRLGLTRRAEIPSTGRLDYGIVELAALATAVRLMAAFMVPSLAARYVAERWETLVPVVLAGARSALPTDYLARRPIGEEAIVLIEATALADLGRQGRHDERYSGVLGNMVGASPLGLGDALRAMGGTGIILDTTDYMIEIVTGYARVTMATEHELAHELDKLRFSS